MKKFFTRLPIWVACVSFVLSLLLTGCGKSDSAKTGERKVLYYQSAMHPWVKSDKPGRCTVCGMELTPIYEGESGLEVGADVITLSSNSIHVLHVQAAEVRRQPLVRTLRFAGTLEADDTKRRLLAAPTAGRIERLHVNYVGAEVQAGQPLADFYSPMLLAAARDYLVAWRSAAETGLAQAAANRLLQLGLTGEQIEHLPHTFGETNFVLPLLAPASGTVIERNVTAGQYVGEGETLFTVADFSTVWLQFPAYEPDLPWLRAGLEASVTTAAHPGQSFTGKITFIDPNLDPVTRAARVRVELDNPVENGRRRFPNRLYAEVAVQLDAPVVLAVPRSAVIQSGPTAVAFVDAGSGAYERRELQLGRRGDALVEVLKGISEGERVVVQGNLLLDGQAEMNRIFAATEPPQPTAANSPDRPALSDRQRAVLTNFFQFVDLLTAALAADDLAAFNQHVAHVGHRTSELAAAFPDGAWHALVHSFESITQFPTAATLPEARKNFRPLSDAAVALAQAVRRADAAFADLKIYRCPMTGDAFPGAPDQLDWLQLRPPLRNPWYGAEMLECGREIGP
ncbi:MAG: efflux RND transporter periplasmic adaptor subunit, partial [Limisphaerales bacterium]